MCATIAALLATPALAHPGGHAQLGWFEAALHALSEPLHVMPALGAATLAIGALMVLRQRRIRARVIERKRHETR